MKYAKILSYTTPLLLGLLSTSGIAATAQPISFAPQCHGIAEVLNKSPVNGRSLIPLCTTCVAGNIGEANSQGTVSTQYVVRANDDGKLDSIACIGLNGTTFSSVEVSDWGLLCSTRGMTPGNPNASDLECSGLVA